ncbi:hypothetical protein FDA94_07035 [Herbidospora galbida]|uniref:Glycosyltransferase n=1 Tax=Herbidospora galbida TaxID=2575442 RepID=A0A4U3MNB6_9ACTN|nr:hypothetical protein [Herbidospora galbida]TKK90164.1 hypothetical protein FDA94_07035 [Herbidospora galbida]
MSELESLRRALAQAVEKAEGAAELARLLADYQARLDEAARTEAEALTRARDAETARKAVEKQAERQLAQLAKQLAEQKYQTAVAEWKLAKLQGNRWIKIGEAVQAKKPGSVARSLRASAPSAKAPKRTDFPVEKPSIQPAAAETKAPPVDPDPRAPLFSTPLTEYFAVPKGPLTRPYMTVAAIVDRRTEALLRYEWRQVTNFGPDNWAKMLDTYRPSMLFVESLHAGPRQGNGGRWLDSMAGQDRALRDLVEACKKRGIKTVFWHSGGSLGKAVPVAELFDLVLATTEQRAREWRAALRHDRVLVLPHSVQPRVHNTFRAEGGRTGGVATLGTAEGGDPLPAQGDDKTSYDDFLTAVRKIEVVVAGPDASDREIAEIEACGTPVVATGAAELAADPQERDRRAHLAWRATVPVTARLEPVFSAVGLPDVRNTQVVTALVAVRDQMELDQAVTQIIGQRRRPDQIVVVAENLDAGVVEKTARQAIGAREEGYNKGVLPELVVRSTSTSTRGAALAHALLLADGDYVAVVDPRDLYGEHYLADSLRRFAEVETEIVGKAAFYAHAAGATLLRQPDAEYRFLPELGGGTIVSRRSVLVDLGIADLSEEWDETLMRQCRSGGIRVYSGDRFSYVCVRARAEGRLFGSARLEGYVPAGPLALI